MRTFPKILVLLATAAIALAQTPAANPPAQPTASAPPKPEGPAPLTAREILRIIDIQNGGVDTIFASLNGLFSGISRNDNRLIVRGQPAVVDMIEAAIKKLDVPSDRVRRVLELKYANATDIADRLRTLFPGVASVGAHRSANADQLVLSGPSAMVDEAEAAAIALDVSSREITHTIQLVNVDWHKVETPLAQNFPGRTTVSYANVVTIRGTPEKVAEIEAVVKTLDQPTPQPPNVELIVQFLLASSKETPGALPPDLESTERQLRGMFAYKGYRVLDTQILRGRTGVKLQTSGNLPIGAGDLSPEKQGSFRLSLGLTVVSRDKSRTIRTEGLSFSVDEPNGTFFTANGQTYSRTTGSSITTDLDLIEGQKTVVGKSNLLGSEDAVFLVITPKVIE